MVVLEEHDYPRDEGATGAESAVYRFCRDTRQPLVVVPDFPSPLWEGGSLGCPTVCYLDPELLYLVSGAAELRLRNPTVEHQVPHEPEMAIILWLTPVRAAFTRVQRTLERRVGVTVVPSSGETVFTIGEEVRVITNHPVEWEGPVTRVSIHPEWTAAHQASPYDEAEEEVVYHVAVDTCQPELVEETISKVYPGHWLGAQTGRRTYQLGLEKQERCRFRKRWGSCGICYDALEMGQVYGCCQYVICHACAGQESVRQRCPNCRESDPLLVAVGRRSQEAPTQPADVFRAILRASPQARVLYVASRRGGPWGSQDFTQVSLLEDTHDEVTATRLPAHDCQATHVICWGSWLPTWKIRAASTQPLQIYHLGLSWQAPFRAAAEQGRLSTVADLPVVRIAYHPPLAALVDRYTRSLAIPFRRLLVGLLLRWEVVTTHGGFQDWDLEALETLMDSWPDSRYVGQLVTCYRGAGAWDSKVEGETVRHADSMWLRMESEPPFNMTELWCQVDPSTRRYLGFDELSDNSGLSADEDEAASRRWLEESTSEDSD